MIKIYIGEVVKEPIVNEEITVKIIESNFSSTEKEKTILVKKVHHFNECGKTDINECFVKSKDDNFYFLFITADIERKLSSHILKRTIFGIINMPEDMSIYNFPIDKRHKLFMRRPNEIVEVTLFFYDERKKFNTLKLYLFQTGPQYSRENHLVLKYPYKPKSKSKSKSKQKHKSKLKNTEKVNFGFYRLDKEYFLKTDSDFSEIFEHCIQLRRDYGLAPGSRRKRTDIYLIRI